MRRFWDTVLSPVLTELQPKSILEIGSDEGHNTRRLLEMCASTQAVLHAIDPVPSFDAEAWSDEFPEAFRFHRALSLDVLAQVGPVDCALIDGDHNWYTVFHELRTLDETQDRFPLVFLHDLGWPYGRRDLYYDPTNIPDEAKHPHRRAGIIPGQSGLADSGGLNAHLWNAEHEGGERNGVRTAVEDFIAQTKRELELVVVPGFHTLGILGERDQIAQLPQVAEAAVLESLEAERLRSEVRRQELLEKVSARETRINQLKQKIEERELRVVDLQKRVDDDTVHRRQLLGWLDQLVLEIRNILSSRRMRVTNLLWKEVGEPEAVTEYEQWKQNR